MRRRMSTRNAGQQGRENEQGLEIFHGIFFQELIKDLAAIFAG